MRWIVIAAWLLLSAASPTPPADGALLSAEPCPADDMAYAAYVEWILKGQAEEMARAKPHGVTMRPLEDFRRQIISRDEYERRRRYAGFECRRITYGSDGLRVKGYLWKPKNSAGKRLPVVIALRGGSTDYSMFGPFKQQGMYAFVSAGFAVVGVQYRGVDGGEGREEYGGRDVAEVLNALKLARSLPDANPDNLFLWGESRGGLMIFRALQEGAKVNAAVVLSGTLDMRPIVAARPEVEKRVAALVPDYATQREAALRARSPILWIDRISTPPILLLTGNRDWRVPPEQSLAMAAKLQALGRPYALHVIDGGDHGLVDGWRERDRLTIDWLKTHLR